ncbi:MAG TPA: ATP-binding cassette domain-containing protein [Mycobacteriales bacterium]|nr:ATP-binding cassette domain-containing protein [Mycobacteriales bacterium]
MAALAAIAGGAPAVFAGLVGLLVGALPGAVRDGFDSASGHRLIVILACAAGVLLLQEIAAAVQSYVTNDLYRRFDEYILGRIMERSLRHPDLWLFDDPEVAAKVDRAARVARFGPGELISGLSTQWTVRMQGFGAAVLMATVRPWLALLLLVVWLIVARSLRAAYYRANPFWTDPFRLAQYLQRIGLMPEWAKEVRIFGLIDWIIGRFSAQWTAVMGELWRARKTDRRTMSLVMEAVLVANLVAVLLIVSGHPATSTVVIAVQALFGMAALASQDGDVWIENGAVPMPDVLEMEEAVGRLPRPAGRLAVGAAPTRAIRLENVHFRYPGRDRSVFAGLDLEIAAGQSLAIVGVNGAGKTTLVKLLAGLCTPQEGRITVDGVDLRDLSQPEWRRHVAAIFQDFVHFELPACDNIAFGSIESALDDASIERAAERAGAEEILRALPAGLDTTLSRRFDGGADLSGGQWQRIALARALMAVQNGARVLMMDEPTAHLDVRAEVALFDRFLELTAGLTTILISHRFSTVRRAHRIIVIDGGAVIESGSHEELVRAGGRYAAMFRAQALRYVGENDG